MDSLISLLGRNGFLPHGYCFTWSPGLLWSMVGADAVIAAAYFSIPVAILSYASRRLLVPLHSVRWADTALSALAVADALVVATEWDEFRQTTPSDVADAIADRVVFDGRNCMRVETWRLAGLRVVQMGRPAAPPAARPASEDVQRSEATSCEPDSLAQPGDRGGAMD